MACSAENFPYLPVFFFQQMSEGRRGLYLGEDGKFFVPAIVTAALQ